MTTRPNDEQEPSMEEILTSIRRIIADEASEEDGEQVGAQDGEQDAGGSRAEALGRDADAAAPGAKDGDAGDDVLELTEVVREDAEVIDLDKAMAQPRSIVEADPGEPGGFEPGGSGPDANEQDLASARDEAAAPRGASPAAAEAAAAQPNDHTAPSSMDIRDDEMEDHQAAMQSNGIEALVSDRAAGAATGAFAKLSLAVQRTPPEVAIADDSGRSVEQFAEDMMRPMLRDWLEENLPPLVERIVQKEIQKIVRRAEDE